MIPPTVLEVNVTSAKTISELAYSVLGAMASSVHCPLNIGTAGKAKANLSVVEVSVWETTHKNTVLKLNTSNFQRLK
jgi:hypothetical protein